MLVLRTPLESQPISAELKHSVLVAYEQMGSPAVAVRSSATAEDLCIGQMPAFRLRRIGRSRDYVTVGNGHAEPKQVSQTRALASSN